MAGGRLAEHPRRGPVAFYAGAFAFLAAVLWTILTTREYPPDDMPAFMRMKGEKAGIGAAAPRSSAT